MVSIQGAVDKNKTLYKNTSLELFRMLHRDWSLELTNKVSFNVQAEAEETAEGLKITVENARHLVASEISISIDCKSVTRTGKKRVVCVVCNVERCIENTLIFSAVLENTGELKVQGQ